MLYAHCDNIHPIFRQCILVFDQYQFVFDLDCASSGCLTLNCMYIQSLYGCAYICCLKHVVYICGGKLLMFDVYSVRLA